MEFRDRYGRTWETAALATTLRLTSPKHEPIELPMEEAEELGLKLLAFKVVTDAGPELADEAV